MDPEIYSSSLQWDQKLTTVPWNGPNDWITLSDMPKIIGATQAFYLIAIVLKFSLLNIRFECLLVQILVVLRIYREECHTANVS